MQILLITAYCGMILMGLILLVFGLLGESWWVPIIGGLMALGSGFTLFVWVQDFRRRGTRGN